jgi:hypothetical protein
MERTFKLENKEMAALDQLEQERTRALAQYGALSIDIKAAEQRINSTVEQQRSFIRSALLHRGVDQFSGAQIVNGSLVVSLPDEEIPSAVSPIQKVNGHELAEQK